VGTASGAAVLECTAGVVGLLTAAAHRWLALVGAPSLPSCAAMGRCCCAEGCETAAGGFLLSAGGDLSFARPFPSFVCWQSSQPPPEPQGGGVGGGSSSPAVLSRCSITLDLSRPRELSASPAVGGGLGGGATDSTDASCKEQKTSVEETAPPTAATPRQRQGHSRGRVSGDHFSSRAPPGQVSHPAFYHRYFSPPLLPPTICPPPPPPPIYHRHGFCFGSPLARSAARSVRPTAHARRLP
jgi:hypothetical protein